MISSNYDQIEFTTLTNSEHLKSSNDGFFILYIFILPLNYY
jgi:hypothetical protein